MCSRQSWKVVFSFPMEDLVMRSLILAVVAICLFADDASACHRGGRSVSRTKTTCSSSVVPAAPAQKAAPAPAAAPAQATLSSGGCANGQCASTTGPLRRIFGRR